MQRRKAPARLAVLGALAFALLASPQAPAGAKQGKSAGAKPAAAAKAPWDVPDNFEPVPVPASNPMSLAKVELGRKVYFDKRLSGDGKLACYSCHVCEHGLTDGRPTAIGAF